MEVWLGYSNNFLRLGLWHEHYFRIRSPLQSHKRRSGSVNFNAYHTEFPTFWIIPIALTRFEMVYWVTPNDCGAKHAWSIRDIIFRKWLSLFTKLSLFFKYGRFSTFFIK